MNKNNFCNSTESKKYSTHTTGKRYTSEYSVYITENNKLISPFHGIQLFQHIDENIVTVVNEIPRFENGKFEITKDIALNPIQQDIKKGNLRYVKNLFPFKGYMWNYGAMPQTWEDKDAVCEYTHCKGDNDPLDVLDISSVRKDIGEVYQAKILGCLALIDDGECDWKILAIDIRDQIAGSINSIDDIDRKYIESTIHWLRNYKIPDGKPANEFGLNEQVMGKEFALNIVKQAHESWKKLMSTQHVENISYITHDGDDVNNDAFEYQTPSETSAYYFLNNKK